MGPASHDSGPETCREADDDDDDDGACGASVVVADAHVDAAARHDRGALVQAAAPYPMAPGDGTGQADADPAAWRGARRHRGQTARTRRDRAGSSEPAVCASATRGRAGIDSVVHCGGVGGGWDRPVLQWIDRIAPAVARQSAERPGGDGHRRLSHDDDVAWLCRPRAAISTDDGQY